MLRFVTVLILLAASAAQAQPIGRVLLAAGEVSALRGGQSVALADGAPIELGDRISTGPQSSAQIRFTDSSIVALRANSELGIERYRFEGKTDGSENALFALLKGGFRTITGQIGRINRRNYAVRTVTSTIGIRGTQFGLVECQSSCFNDDGKPAADGTYGIVYDGLIAAAPNNRLDVDTVFRPEQPFHVANPDTPALRLVAPPVFLSDQLDGQQRFAGRTDPQAAGTVGNSSNARGFDVRAQPSPAYVAYTAQVPVPFVATESRTAAGGTAVLGTAAAAGAAAPTAPAVLTAVTSVDASYNYSFPSVRGSGDVVESFSMCLITGCGNTAAVVSNGQLQSYSTSGGASFPSGNSNSAVFGAGGITVADGNEPFQAQWGVWGNSGSGVSVVRANGSPCPGGGCFVNALVYGYTASPHLDVLPSSGSVTYNYAGGPTGTYFSSVNLSVNSMTANVNFTARTLSFNASLGYALTNTPPATITLNTPSPVAIGGNNMVNNAILNVGCAGTLCGSTTSIPGGGTLNVRFAGSAAQAAIAHGSFQDPVSTFASSPGVHPQIPYLGVLTR
jgi:hypothetical protein